MNRRTLFILSAMFFSAGGFVCGYFWPRAHYEIRTFRNGMMICAVDGRGNAGCAPANGLVPYFPSEFMEFKNGACTDGEGRAWPVRADGLCYAEDKDR